LYCNIYTYTGIDIVQTQIRIAAGATLKQLGLTQDKIKASGVALQCRVTTEDPARDFSPDTGVLEVFRVPGGMGIRVDDGPGFPGAVITPHYDSLLVKITAHAADRADCVRKLVRAVKELRVRGVTTNKSFVLGVLSHPDFTKGIVDTSFIADNPQLLTKDSADNRGTRLLSYIGHITVNGPPESLGAVGPKCSKITPKAPDLHAAPFFVNSLAKPLTSSSSSEASPKSLRQIYLKEGPSAFAKAVRANKGLLLMDTTWRDAHQSLLATRVRTIDILKIAPATAVAMPNLYSIENWGGATFDVAMRFLNESPWQRLDQMREVVPDIPFQMLLRGANAVGYTSYPDNVGKKFVSIKSVAA
jgi:pyruvate carboxylase